MSIRGFRLTAAQTVDPAELADPRPEAGEVLIEVERAGICGSDIEYYRHFQCGVFVPRGPMVLGHEFAGTVIGLGAGVTSVQKGARVTVEPSVPCGHCSFCREGRYNLCDNMRFFGTAATYPHIDGGFRERVTAPASNTIVLPEVMSSAAGALLEPLAVAVHAVRRGRPVDGADVLVVGGGTIGQLVSMVAQAYGARSLTLSDPVDSRRDFAQAHGAGEVIDPRDGALLDAARQRPRGGWDLVLEASGSEAGVAGGIAAARKGGTFVQIGTIAQPITIPVNLIMVRELDVRGSFRYNHDFPAARAILATGALPLMDVITRTFDFAETPEAFAVAASGQELKVQVARD